MVGGVTLSNEHIAWFGSKGIDAQFAMNNYGVRSVIDELLFPYPSGIIKYRVLPKKFRMDGPISLYYSPLAEMSETTMFIVEGESDCICLAQYVGPENVMAISGLNGWKPEYAARFKDYETVYIILDNDADYLKADKTWDLIRTGLGNKAKRITLPTEVKDVCEFFTNFTAEALSILVAEAKEGKTQFHYEALDLTAAPPEYDWLVSDWIARGDLCCVVGDSGIGKSWITMSLAVAIAEGHDEWLGMKLDPHNRAVYYIDEENPPDVIYKRLKGLGLSLEGAKNIRYISDAGVKLDKNARYVLDEAIAWNPALVVVDSLTRVHTGDENSVSDMSKVLNNALRPLARATGATCIVIHHNNKNGDPRGSSDIRASVDTMVNVSAIGDGGIIALRQTKSRRSERQREPLRCKIQDTAIGTGLFRLATGMVQF
jgi:KaiC/GvpD/RAD55 family RecA-like ATPase